MKIPELKEVMKDMDAELVKKVLIEVYKQFPKRKKEEDIDPLIQMMLETKGEKKVKKAKGQSFDELERDIHEFLEHAKAGNYIKPNREIPKVERSKWRFKVMQYYKALTSIAPEDAYFDRAIVLLEDIYQILAQGCNVYLFSSGDPFASIKVAQEEFYGAIVQRVFHKECTSENAIEVLNMAVSSGLSSECIHLELEVILYNFINEHSVKLGLEQHIKEEVKRLEQRIKEVKLRMNIYYMEEHINELCNMLLLLGIKFNDSDEALLYFFQHVKERDKEIVLYRALDILRIMEEYTLWIRLYEGALKKKLVPRESLKIRYEKIKEKVKESREQ